MIRNDTKSGCWLVKLKGKTITFPVMEEAESYVQLREDGYGHRESLRILGISVD